MGRSDLSVSLLGMTNWYRKLSEAYWNASMSLFLRTVLMDFGQDDLHLPPSIR